MNELSLSLAGTRRLVLLTTLAVLVTLFAASNAAAATFRVNDREDLGDANPGDGICQASNGRCTARAAFEEANAIPSNDRIFVPARVFVVDDGELPVTDNGSLSVFGDRNFGRSTAFDAAGDNRVIDVDDDSDLRLVGVTVTGGRTFQEGAGVNIGLGAEVDIVRSRISGNRSLSSGGGISNAGDLFLRKVDVEKNGADANGGGILNGEDFFEGFPIPADQARGGNGPAPANLELELTRVTGNDTDFGGGGIFTGVGEVRSYRSTIANNLAGQFGGGILASPEGTQQPFPSGQAQGPNGPADALVVLRTSTISSNTAGATGLGIAGDGSGGGILMFVGSELISRHTTIADNINHASDVPTGAGLALGESEASIFNTIIAENRTNGDLDNCRWEETLGVITSEGHNLENDDECGFDQATDVQNINPRIGRLRRNQRRDGSRAAGIETHRIGARSPALNAGPKNCGPIDQRGVDRPVGNRCDIGSFERKPGG